MEDHKMADKMKAVAAYCPRVKLAPLKDAKDITELLAMRTGLLESQVKYVLTELRDIVRFYAAQGHPVRLDGLGIYSPGVELNGTMAVHHRADRFLVNELNKPGGYRGEILHRENIGKSREDLVTLWNESHPDNPVPPD
jgi:hypothetical protein